MESVTTFMEIFSRFLNEGNHDELGRLLADAPTKYFQDVPASQRALVLSHVFDPIEGVLRYQRAELDDPDLRKKSTVPQNRGLELIEFLSTEYADVYEPYVKLTAEICVQTVIVKSGHHVKQTAARMFRNLLIAWPNVELPFDAIVKDIMEKFHRYDERHKPIVMKVLCAIARFHPDTEGLKKDEPRIKHLLNMLADLSCHREKEYTINMFEPTIESLMDFSTNFPPNEAEVRPLYNVIKKVSEFAEKEDNRYKILECVISFVIQMLPSFSENILKDDQYWQKFFNRLIEKNIHKNLATNALRVYYEEMSRLISKKFMEGDTSLMLAKWKDKFEKTLKDGLSEDKQLSTAAVSYSRLVQSMKYTSMNDDITEMFNLIARRITPLYFDDKEASKNLADLADYQESLSRVIICIPNVTADQMKSFTKLTILLMKKFGELPRSGKEHAVASLKRTIENASQLRPQLYNEYLSVIIYHGIQWSCSHAFFIDSELRRDLANSIKGPLCYKDYVFLWKGLLTNKTQCVWKFPHKRNATQQATQTPKSLRIEKENYENYSLVQKDVINTILDTCLTLISKLNLNLKTKPDNFCYNPVLSQTAENETDLRIFLNMVDLYDEVLKEMEPKFWGNRLSNFLYTIIKASYNNPLISGFYRLVNRILNSSQAFFQAGEANLETFNMVLQHLLNVIDKIYKFPVELQIVSIQLILQVPQAFIPHLIDHVSGILKIAFKIGLNDYEFANLCLDALENYMSFAETDKVKAIYREIIPCLNLYLKSKESFEIHLKENPMARQRLQKQEESFENLQNRILLLFGRVDNSLMLEFLHRESQNTGASWDSKNLLEYSMTFPDGSLDVYLDTILPRIIDLALNCNDRRTKVAASEALHSIIAIILGKTMHFLAADPNRFSSLYKILCPALLRLGCDPDDIVQELFHLLMVQITHWLSSKLMQNSPAVDHLLDALFDGLCDDSNSSLRDFSGICLAEFAKWSIKQTSDNDLSQESSALNSIAENIKHFALHPWSRRRVAAAIAFNHLYRILRENNQVVNVYWLELFYCFVKSIDGCDEKCISDALDHLERVIVERFDIFETPDPLRKIPDEFAGETLKDAINWLLTRCGRPDRNASKKSIHLFENMSLKIASLGSPKNVITAYIEMHGLDGLNNIILENLNEATVDMTDDHLQNLLKALDFYNWLLDNQLLEANSLFPTSNPCCYFIFTCIRNFIESMGVMNTSLDCEIILAILNFAVKTLQTRLQNEADIHEAIFSDKFFLLLERCILEPQNVGFNMTNPQLAEQLPVKLEKIVVALKTHSSLKKTLIEKINVQGIRLCDWSDAFSFPELISQWRDPIDVRIIQGLILLKKCKLLNEIDIGKRIVAERKEKMLEIFEILKNEVGNEIKCVEIEDKVKIYLEHCLELFLDEQVPIMAVIDFIGNKTQLIRNNNSKTLHGEYYFSMFRQVIVRCLMREYEKSVDILLAMLEGSSDANVVFFLLEEMTIWMQRYKTDDPELADNFAKKILSHSNILRLKMLNIDARKKHMKNIFPIIIRLLRDPSNVSTQFKDFRSWMLEFFNDTSGIVEKTLFLNDYLICLANESITEDEGLRHTLRALKNLRKREYPGNKNQAIETMNISECFQTMMTLLPMTKSIIVLDAAINFSMGAGIDLHSDGALDHLKLYFSLISTENAYKSLELIFRLYMDTIDTREREDIERGFFIPALETCSSPVIEKFFEKNIKEIFSTIVKIIPINIDDARHLIMSQTGCYILLQHLFFIVDESKINQPDSLISMNAFNGQNAGQQLTPQIFKAILNVRKVQVTHLELKEHIRLLHCAAYNCCITIASNRKEAKYYLALFAESPDKNQFIWKKIIDCDKQYNLTQIFKKLPQKKKVLATIKDRMKKKKKFFEIDYSCIKSYDLASSTLTEDIYAYDLSEIIPMKEPSNDAISSMLEDIDFNKHECMHQICGILKYMIENNLELIDQSPNWLECFISSMSSKYQNVKLYLLQVLLNNQNEFKAVVFAKKTVGVDNSTIIKVEGLKKSLVSSIMIAITKLLEGGTLNYIITDTLLMLIDWTETDIPAGETMRIANAMFSQVVDKIESESTAEYIVRYNFSITDMLVKVWGDILNVPNCLEEKMVRKPQHAVRIILIFLVNNLGSKLVNREDILNYLINTLENDWKEREDHVLHICESIGLFIRSSESLGIYENRKMETVEKIRTIFTIIEPTKLIKCINAMSKACPILSTHFSEFVFRNHMKLAPQHKGQSMQVLFEMIPYMTTEQILDEMKQMKFNDLLKDKVLQCELICLKIIQRLALVFSADDFLPLAKLARVYSRHEEHNYRQHVYHIFIDVYKKYQSDISLDEHGERLLDMSKQILLPGLLEPIGSLFEEIKTFWTKDIKFGDNCADIILNIFDVYSENIGKDFLPIFSILFLHFSMQSPDYNKNLFEPLDPNCHYKYVKIVGTNKMRNLSYSIPLFANSYAVQYSQPAFTATLHDYVAVNEKKLLDATVLPNYQLTVENDTVEAGTSGTQNTIGEDATSGVSVRKKIKKIRHLVHKDPMQRTRNLSDVLTREEKMKAQAIKQRTSVKMSRGYTYGDLPDTAISHSKILDPLQSLLKKDQITCKNFVVSTINSLIQRLALNRQTSGKLKYKNFIETISKRFKFILENRRGHSLIVSAVLEILIHNSQIEFDANLVAYVSKITGVNHLGALLLERNLLKDPDDEEPASKKIRSDNEPSVSNERKKINQWIQLTELYESTQDVDVFLSIFQNHVEGEELYKASRARAASRWDLAEQAYRRAYDSSNESIRRHCQKGIYECLARLSNWDELAKKVDEDFGGEKGLGDFLKIARSPKEGWRTPWYFQSNMYLYQEDPENNDEFRIEVNNLRKIPKAEELLQEFFGEDLALFWPFDKKVEAKDQIIKALKVIKDQWIQLNHMSFQLRTYQIWKLQSLCNVSMFRKVSDDLSNIESTLLKFWSETHPSANDDLLRWDIQINNRSNFGKLLTHELETRFADDNDQCKNRSDEIDVSILQQFISLIDAAYKQQNLSLIRKYIHNAEFYEKANDFREIFILKKAEGAFQEALIGNQKVRGYTKCWERCQKVLAKLRGPAGDKYIQIAALQLLSEVSLSLKKFSLDHRENFNIIMEKIGAIENFDAYSLDKLVKSSVIAEQANMKSKKIADCHLRILKYCYMKIIGNEATPELVKQFVQSTLSAMKHGSQEAGHYFPCLLKLEYLNNAEIRYIFESICKKIPSWRFLTWQSQLLAHLFSDLDYIVAPIIERIAEDYPNALVYTLRATADINPELDSNPTILKVKQRLLRCPDVDLFVEALQYLVPPQLYLEYHLKELLKNLDLGKSDIVDELLKKVYPEVRNPPLQGNLYKKIAKYQKEIELIREMPKEDIKAHVGKIMSDLNKDLITTNDCKTLKEYSPYLSQFTGSDFEIPGQYTGDKKPLPKYHTKITKIEPRVEVMASLRKPVRITMVGNDAKNFNFLVKFGEDLRLDQTVEQAFSTMDGILKSNMACLHRNLSISTYQVIPLSGSLGLIQWIDGTKTLEEYVHFSLSQSQKKQYIEDICIEYEEWIKQASPESRQLFIQYKEAVLLYNAETVIKKMKSFIDKTGWDILRRTFVKLNTSPESYVSSRRNFIVTYATMCAAHWIIGVGDRHLKNTLISVKSGMCTGIDFAAAFGGAIDQSIPELVPFRLTNQLTGLMKPFDEHDLFGATMIHVIRALRDGKGPILASIDGIAHQKLTWIANARHGPEETEKESWVPRKKINSVLKKLDGAKPSKITLEDLENQHRDKYYERYKEIVEGKTIQSIRSKMSDDGLSPEEQVKCLLEQATDSNILGRTYSRWMPWL